MALKEIAKYITGRITLFGSTSITNEGQVGIPVLSESDGTVRSQAVLFHSGTTQIRQKAETDGTAMVSNYGKAAGTLTAFKVRSTGEQDMLLNGTDEAGNIDTFRTDPNRIQWTRPYEGWVFVDGAAIPAVEGVLLDGSASLVAAGLYLVEFLVINIDGTNDVAVSIGRDDGAGGSLSATEYWMSTEGVPADQHSEWKGPFLMNGDDDIRGVAGAADDAIIQFRVRRVDVGA